MSWDENGLSVGEGIVDHLTWHCFGTGDFINSTGLGRGYCVWTDPSGRPSSWRGCRRERTARTENMERIRAVYVRHWEVCRHYWRIYLFGAYR